MHPDDYNVEFPVVDPSRTEITLRADMSLSELTICLGQEKNPYGWFRTLRNLNPRLEPGDRVEKGDTLVVPAVVAPLYEERCRGGEIVKTEWRQT